MEQTVPSEPLAITEAITEASHIEKAVDREIDAGAIEVFGDPNLDHADAVSAINIQAWLNQSPWRVTAGWSAMAGLLSMGILTSLFDWRGFLGWPIIVLALLLVDPIWGSLWRFAWGRDGILPLGKAQQGYTFWLPYLKNNSPAGRLMGKSGTVLSNNDLAPFLFRVGLPTIGLAYVVSATLGGAALWLTSGVVACVLLGWLGRRTWGRPSALLQAVVSTTLPWVLAVLLFQGNITLEQSILDAVDERIFYSYLLVALWTVHMWGIIVSRRMPNETQEQQDLVESSALMAPSTALQPDLVQNGGQKWGALPRMQRLLSRPALALLLLADAGTVVLMIVLQEPLWLALMVPLWLPMWFAYLQGMAVDRQQLWRLLALLVSAVAVGQTPLT